MNGIRMHDHQLKTMMFYCSPQSEALSVGAKQPNRVGLDSGVDRMTHLMIEVRLKWDILPVKH